MIKPRKLQPGDRIAAVSLSWGGPGAIPHRYEAGKKQLQEEFGIQLVETRHALKDPSWLARNPQARAQDLMEAFADPSVNGIISTIGGDDSIRLLRHMDIEVIRQHPKVFLGYSDATVSHLLCFRAGLVSFYGPSVMAGFGENRGMFPFMVRSVRQAMFSTEPIGRIEPNIDGWTVERLDWNDPRNQLRRRTLNPSTGWRFLQGRGMVQGRLIGGCLDVLEWLPGTLVWPELGAFDGAILFLETSEEAPLPVSVVRALRIFAAMGILQRLSGILFGRPGGAVPIDEFHRYDEAILRVVAEEEGLTDLAIITNMDFGHTDPMFVLPYGVNGQIDCDRQEFLITESAVID